MEGLRIYGSQPDKCSILSFTIDGTHPYDVGMILDKLGIAVRTGTHCAEPVMAHYGITSMVRASLAMYNTFGEIDMLASRYENRSLCSNGYDRPAWRRALAAAPHRKLKTKEES